MKVIIVGAGKLGLRIAESLVFEEVELTVVDKSPTPLRFLNENYDILTVHANGLELNVLDELSIETYDLLISTTFSDEANVLICSLAKKMGCKQTIARIRNPEHLEQMAFIKEEMEIDMLINPDAETANVITKYLTKNLSLYTGDFAKGEVQLNGFYIGDNQEFVNKKLMDIPALKPVIIASITRGHEILIPHGKTVLEKSDLIYVMGKKKDIEDLKHKFEEMPSSGKVKSAMILGGGKLGYYLAKEFVKEKIDTIIIESNIDRCRELASDFPEALIIEGDGTDIDLLEAENLQNVDAFIAATGLDEINILMALVAKQHGVNHSISKISRQNYNRIVDTLDVDASFNPTHITASNILKNIRGGRVISVSLLLGGDAEATELIVSKNSPLINKALKDLNLPEGLIIGAIISGGKVTVPDGFSILKPNDRVVVFSLNEGLAALKLFLGSGEGKKGFLEFFKKH
ncbi:MAG: Trk system potassium transporter TrkA [Tissierellia bacterium]|nr:Trk system potassium transporter TrkA [Tissierellia bacterium]